MEVEIHQSRVVSPTKGPASSLQSFRSGSLSSNGGSWASSRRPELIDGAFPFPSGNALFVLLTYVATCSHCHSLFMEKHQLPAHSSASGKALRGGLEKGLEKTQTPLLRTPGDKWRNLTFSRGTQVCSRFVQACFSTQASRTRSDAHCTAAIETIAWFWSSMAGLRISVITQFLGIFIQTLPFPDLHRKAWPEELGVLAEDMEVHMDSPGVCSPQERSNWLQLESWDMPAPRPNPGFQVCTSRNEGRSQPWGVEWHHMK